MESQADVLAKITVEDLTMILEKIEKIEQKLERKIDDISLEVCKFQDADSFALTLSREHISYIKDENVQLKAENIHLKKELENATLVMSDLNEHVKLMGEEKQSLITALKILQNNEIDDCRNKRWHIASDRKHQKVPQFKPIEVSTDSEDNYLSTNRYSELTDEARLIEQQVEETSQENEQQIKVTSQPGTSQTNMPRGQQSSKLPGQKPSRRKNKARDQREQQTEQDGPNVLPNLRETNQPVNRNRTDSAATDLSKRDRNNNNSKPDVRKPILIIGDSIIKHIDPNKLSRRTVHKFTYRGKTCEQISEAIDNTQTKIDPSHVIIHCGTNNLPIDSAEVCATKMINLATKVKNKFPNAKVGVSGLTYREDVSVNPIRVEVNEKLKNLSVIHEFSYIDNSKIDNTCWNKSKLHLNDKGTSLLAVHFIKFVRGLASNSRRSGDRDKGFQMVLCKQLGEMLMKIGNPRLT